MALTPWREAAIPQREVYEGRYEQARFAADLGKVLAGTADSEYQDGAEFYSRTYLTDGMRRLLIDVVERVAGTEGEIYDIVMKCVDFTGSSEPKVLYDNTFECVAGTFEFKRRR